MRGFLAGHVGRQKIAVVRTATKNTPSYVLSLFRSARYISSLDGSFEVIIYTIYTRRTAASTGK
jgi:hypothetical protein